MQILGISAFYHDSAAALIRDGAIVAAAQEERFTRRKHTAAFPRQAIAYCLDEGGVDVGGLDAVVFYDKPLLKFERPLDTYIATAPRGFASFRASMPVWIGEKLFLKRRIARELGMTGVRTSGGRGPTRPHARRLCGARRCAADVHRRRGSGRGKDGRLVSGPDGVWLARPGRTLDPRRSTPGRYAADAQSQDQVPRGLPPVCAAVLREEAANWFDLRQDSPFMSLVVPVRSAKLDETSRGAGLARLGLIESDLPAVTHVDGSARVQTVDAATNPRFHRLIGAFHDRTGCPVLVNTSFNVRGEPIVCTPEDAFRCFMKTGLDVLAIENCILYKDSQDRAFATRTAIDPTID